MMAGRASTGLAEGGHSASQRITAHHRRGGRHQAGQHVGPRGSLGASGRGGEAASRAAGRAMWGVVLGEGGCSNLVRRSSLESIHTSVVVSRRPNHENVPIAAERGLG